MEITRQSDYYGFADPRLAALADERTAAVRPDEVADLLHGPRIQAGQHATAEEVEAAGFRRGPVPAGRATTASNDPDMDLFHELFDRGMSWDEMGKEIAQRNYTDNEERKAFRKGWRAALSGTKDTEHYDRLTDSWPRNLMHAFFSAYEIVREYR